MSESDWDSVTVLRKKAPKPSDLKDPKTINAALRAGGQIDTTKKFAAGTNRQHAGPQNAVKLDQETEDLHIETIGMDVGKIIAQARNAKGWTQKDLAAKICEKPQVINEYEGGKGIPNQQVMTKLERALEVKLRGKDKGAPLEPRAAKKSTSDKK
ncbi:hypothetical protein RvY_13593 [Ramazzottius varieornatus]|uniref:HTH cro/C1-type domain-containing protein n=1 Tax=Ramazzottius varieornatus TaxID=947166 RepID=A0A1D1VQJ8_RAMVA|nr:hypothetical protein RvY_13593 [Ramazzottius varieornatus]